MRFDSLKIGKYLGILILIQPILDLITSLTIKYFDVNLSAGMIVRFIFLSICLIYLAFYSTSKKRKISLIAIGITMTYMLMYISNNIYLKGIGILFGEVKYLLKLFYFPFLLLSFWNMVDEKWFEIKDYILVKIAIIYSSIILIAQFTGTQFVSYSHNKLGHSGWFFSPNEIGAITAILAPIIFWYVITDRKKVWVYGLIFLYVYSMFIIGTKVPLLGVIISTCGFVFFYFLKIIVEKKNYISVIVFPLLIIAMMLIVMVPNTPVGINLNIHLKMLEVNNTEELYKPQNKDKLSNFVFSSRDVYLKKAKEKYDKANIKERLLGLGSSGTEEQTVQMIEIDYYDIFYRNGVLGFIFYFMPFLLVAFEILRNTLKKFRKIVVDIEIIKYVIGLLLAAGIAYFAGHVFLAPAVSIYVIILLVKLEKRVKHLSL